MLQLSEPATWVVGAAISALLALLVYGARIPDRLKYRHIPGPPPRWLTGNVNEFMGARRHETFTRIAERYGSIYKMFLGAEPYVVVCDAELARTVMLRNPTRFENSGPGAFTLSKRQKRQQQSGLFAVSDRSFHKALKHAWMPSMNSATLGENAKLMEASAVQMADLLEKHAEQGTEVNIWRHFGAMTLDVVGTTALGVEFNTQDPSGKQTPESQAIITAMQDFFRYGGESSSIYGKIEKLFPFTKGLLCYLATYFPDKGMRQFKKSQNIMDNISLNLIKKTRLETDHSGIELHVQAGTQAGSATGKGAERKARGLKIGTFPRQMVAAVNPLTNQPLSDPEVAAQLNTFLLAGYETTATSLGFLTYNLAAHPDKMQKLLKEVDSLPKHEPLLPEHLANMPYTEACFREAIRLYGPVTAMGRSAYEDMQLGKYHIPKGTRLIVPFFTIQHDSKYWPNPEAFIPERWIEGTPEYHHHTPGSWMPFGEGTRICAGQRFAYQEIKITVARLFQRYTFNLQPGQVPMELDTAVTLAPKSLSIRVVPVKR